MRISDWSSDVCSSDLPVGRPAAIEQDVDAFLDLFLEAVVKVVVHLLDEFVVVKAVEIEIVVFRHHLSSRQERPGLLSCSPIGFWVAGRQGSPVIISLERGSGGFTCGDGSCLNRDKAESP